MAASSEGNGPADGPKTRNGHRRVEVTLTEEQFAALEGWRSANRVADRSDAVRELVRLGLLAEIGRVYRLISGAVDGDDPTDSSLNMRG